MFGCCNPAKEWQYQKPIQKPSTLWANMDISHDQKKVQWNTMQQQQLIKFVDAFYKQLEGNVWKLKEYIRIILNSADGTLDKQPPSFSFMAIEYLYYSLYPQTYQSTDNLTFIRQRLIEPYVLSYSYVRSENLVIRQIYQFLEDIKIAIVSGFIEDQERFQKRKTSFRSEDLKLLQKIEQIIQLAKESFKKERSRTFVEELQNGQGLEENQKLRQMIQQQQQTISRLEQTNEKLTNENNTYQAVTIPNLKSKLAKYQAEAEEHKSMEKQTRFSEQNNNEKNDKVIEDQQQRIKLLQEELLALQNVRDSMTNKNSTIELEVSQLKKQNIELTELTAKSEQLSLLLSKKEEELTSTLKLLEQFKHENNQSLRKVQSEQMHLAKTRRQLLQAEEQIQKLKDLNMELAGRIEDLSHDSSRFRTKSFVEHNTLFIGDILESRKSEKRYLLKNIESLKGSSIFKTKLLYEYPKDKQLNFHKIIDQHCNLVLIVETIHGMLVAAYYSGSYKPKTALTEEGLILSLSNYQCYFLNQPNPNPKKDKKEKPIYGMIYDQFFLIFGNSELRIKNGENKLFSNFGVNNAYFNSRGDKVNIILGQGKVNQVEIVSYEIHQVHFDGEVQ